MQQLPCLYHQSRNFMFKLKRKKYDDVTHLKLQKGFTKGDQYLDRTCKGGNQVLKQSLR